MGIAQMTYESTLLDTCESNWIKDGYNVGILSAYVTQPPNITKMIQLFSLNIWSLILISTLVITLFNEIYDRLKCVISIDHVNYQLVNFIFFT